MKKQHHSLIKKIFASKAELPNKIVFSGFDAACDLLAKPILMRDENHLETFQSIKQFGQYLEEKKGKSCSIEYKIETEKIGGNMPNFVVALGASNVKSHAVGMLGIPIKELFYPMKKYAELYSYGNPIDTLSFEFMDGKIMMYPYLETDAMEWNKLKDTIGLETMRAAVKNSDCCALMNWGEIPSMHNIWEGFFEEVVDFVPRDSFLFFDLADFSNRPVGDVNNVINLIGRYAKKRETIVGLNENEASLISKLILKKDLNHKTFCTSMSKVFYGVQFIVHTVYESYTYVNNESYYVKTDYCESPKFSTGAGDNYNAGYCIGKMLGFDVPECLKLGNTFSRYYIEMGESPNINDIAETLLNGI